MNGTNDAAGDYRPPARRTEVYWASGKMPATRAELDAAIILTGEIAEIDRPATGGFSVAFYHPDRFCDVRDVLPDGSTGHLLILPAGDMPGAFMDAWPVKIERYQAEPDLDPVKLRMHLQVTGDPGKRRRIPW